MKIALSLNNSANKIQRDLIDCFKLSNDKTVICVAFMNQQVLNSVTLYKNNNYFGTYDWLGRALSRKREFDEFLFGPDFPLISEDLTLHHWIMEFIGKEADSD